MEELALHILDLLENSLAAGAGRLELNITEDAAANRLIIEVADDGRGMNKEQAGAALDPFFTTRRTRRVGLGLPLLKSTAEQCEGSLTLASQPGKGTRVVATMALNHVDCPPLGNLGATIAAVLGGEEPPELLYRHRVNGKEFTFSTAWLKTHLGEVPLQMAPVLKWVQDYINRSITELHGGEN